MDDQLQQLENRVARIEQRLGLSTGVAQPTNAVSTLPPPPPPPSAAMSAVGTPEVSYDSSQGADWSNIEQRLGRYWLPIIGVLAVLVSAALFLRYAFAENLIGEVGRVMLWLIGGFGFIGTGMALNKRMPAYSWILFGGGIALLYTAIYSAFAFYSLIGDATAFLFMIAITTFGVVLSIVFHAEILAGIAFVGGYLTPLLLSTGANNYAILFAYIIMLNFGVLVIASFRNWRTLNLIALLGTVFLFFTWYASHYSQSLLVPAQLVLAICFIEFLVATIMGNLMSSENATRDDLGLLVGNAAWFYSMSYALLSVKHDAYLGLFTALVAAVYVVLAYLSLYIKQSDAPLKVFLGGLALLFTTIVFPVELDGEWVTIAWLAEAVILCWAAVAVAEERIGLPAGAIYIIALGRLLFLHTDIAINAGYLPIINERFMLYVLAILSATALGYLYSSPVFQRDPFYKNAPRGLYLVANGLLLAILSMEVMAYFTKQIRALTSTDYRTYPYEKIRSLRSQSNVALSVLWSVYASIVMGVGMMRDSRPVRLVAIALFIATLAKVVLVDMSQVNLVIRFISFLVLGILLLIASFLYYRKGAHQQSTV